MIRLVSVLFAFLLAFGGLAGPAQAQIYAVFSVSNVALGTVAGGITGQTVIRVNPDNGVTSTVSGAGGRVATTSVRSLVTVGCAGGSVCSSSAPLITVYTPSTASGRMGAPTNFTVSTVGATATLATQPTTGSSITFLLQPIPDAAARTFWVGFDVPIAGDNSALAGGARTVYLAVQASRSDYTMANGLYASISATIVRGLAITKSSDLAFGRVFAPTSGTGSVSINATTGARTVTGTGAVAAPGAATSAAQFSIAGEGGQAISVTVPATFSLTSPNGTISVATSATASGAQVLSGTSGTAGALVVRVGGSYNFSPTTPPGIYSGLLTVNVAYN
ncbi:MAG: DUF4402 domain-containing protein [Novosphingobium sp.]